MVSGFEVIVACPLVSFFFARLGATLGVSVTSFPSLGTLFLQVVG